MKKSWRVGAVIFLVFLICSFAVSYGNAETQVKKENYPNGKLWEEIIYRDGKQEQMKEYYESGELKSERFYKNGVMDGVMKEYYENGAVRFEWLYKDGKPEGVRKEYYENGAVKSEWPYRDGKLNGVMKYYDKDSNVTSEKAYNNGMPTDSDKLYDKMGNVTREIGIMQPNLQEAKVKIISPSSGSVFHSGDTVTVKVNTPSEISMVLIAAGAYASTLCEKPPYELEFIIPQDASSSSIEIMAGGRDDKGNSFGSDTISINVLK